MNTKYMEVLGYYRPPASSYDNGDQWNIRNRVAACQRHPGCYEPKIHGNTEPCLWPMCDSFKKGVYRESAQNMSLGVMKRNHFESCLHWQELSQSRPETEGRGELKI
jgi:hypothetical protein